MQQKLKLINLLIMWFLSISWQAQAAEESFDSIEEIFDNVYSFEANMYGDSKNEKYFFRLFSGYDEQKSLLEISSKETDKIVFKIKNSQYSKISFLQFCQASNGYKRLLFKLSVDGTANADIRDLMFVYYDEQSNQFISKTVDERYLNPVCHLEGAQTNENIEIKRQKALKSIYKKLTDPNTNGNLEQYAKTGKALPTKTITFTALSELVATAKLMVYDNLKEKLSGYIYQKDIDDYYSEMLSFKVIDENQNWRIIEFGYYANTPGSSWGVLIAHNKKNNQYTVFRSSSSGDSNTRVYLDTDVKLKEGALRVKAKLYYDELVEINLDSFIVKKINK